MSGLSRRFFYNFYKETENLKTSADLHAKVAEAVASKKIPQAMEASDNLMAHIVELTKQAMDY